MREIKFRGWVKENQKMVRITGFDFDDKYGEWEYEDGENYCISQEHIELMQYTGLKDKNGKDIYEGDIIKFSWKKHVGLVKFGIAYSTADDLYSVEQSLCYYVEWFVQQREKALTEGLGNEEGGTESKDIEIIGNIYETPELLEDKNDKNNA